MRGVIGLVIAMTVAAAGCGNANPSVYSRARATAESFVERCARGDPERAAEVLTQPLRAAFIRSGPDPCARLLGLPPAAARVSRVVVHGARATATVAAPARPPADIELGFFEDQWMVDGPAARL